MRYLDADGHEWPITGVVCTICGLPLTPVDDHDTHPNCERTTS